MKTCIEFKNHVIWKVMLKGFAFLPVGEEDVVVTDLFVWKTVSVILWGVSTRVVIIKEHYFSSRMFSLKLVRNFSISRRTWRHSAIISFGHRILRERLSLFFSLTHSLSQIVTPLYSAVQEPCQVETLVNGLRLATMRPNSYVPLHQDKLSTETIK